jgi:hypothetical protein
MVILMTNGVEIGVGLLLEKVGFFLLEVSFVKPKNKKA